MPVRRYRYVRQILIPRTRFATEPSQKLLLDLHSTQDDSPQKLYLLRAGSPIAGSPLPTPEKHRTRLHQLAMRLPSRYTTPRPSRKLRKDHLNSDGATYPSCSQTCWNDPPKFCNARLSAASVAAQIALSHGTSADPNPPPSEKEGCQPPANARKWACVMGSWKLISSRGRTFWVWGLGVLVSNSETPSSKELF